MATALAAFADALARAGRGAEAGKYLDEAKSLAPTLKSDAVDGSILNAEGDLKFYQGDTKGAAALYEQAGRLAAKTSDTDVALLAKLNIDKIAVAEGRNRVAIGDLRLLAQKSDEQGRRILAVEASVLMAEAMLKDKDIAHANRREFLGAAGGTVVAAALSGGVPASATVATSPSQATGGRKKKIPIGVFDPVYDNLTLDEMLERVSALGLEAMKHASCRPEAHKTDVHRRVLIEVHAAHCKRD